MPRHEDTTDRPDRMTLREYLYQLCRAPFQCRAPLDAVLHEEPPHPFEARMAASLLPLVASAQIMGGDDAEEERWSSHDPYVADLITEVVQAARVRSLEERVAELERRVRDLRAEAA